MSERQGAYIGLLDHLQGRRALVRPDPQVKGGVLAQFDDRDAQRSGVNLSLGWHMFRAEDFRLDALPRAFKGMGVSSCHHCGLQLMFKQGGGGFTFDTVLTPDNHEVRVHKQCKPLALGDGYKEKT